MSSAIDDIHHRNRKDMAVDAAEIPVKRHSEIVCGGLGYSEGNTENGVCSEVALGWSAVKLDHSHIDGPLVEGGHSDNFLGDLGVDVLYSLEYALSTVALRVSVAKLESLVLAGGRS